MRHEVQTDSGKPVIDVYTPDDPVEWRRRGRVWRASCHLLRELPMHAYPPDQLGADRSRWQNVFEYLYSLAWDEHE